MAGDFQASVILCTHNPKEAVIARTLEGLMFQTLDYEKWELLLIDNASALPLCETLDLSWHPNGRVVREDTLGLTAARKRGIIESRAGVLVFVDDDNVLEPDYLAEALAARAEHSELGAWGGRIVPEFAEEPEEWTKPYWYLLAIRDIEKDRQCSEHVGNNCIPCGAGMCVLRLVAERYLSQLESDDLRSTLDRKGDSLVSDGDTDLALTACDMGMSTGEFARLKLTHLIPPERLTKEYFLKIFYAMNYSGTVLKGFREETKSALVKPGIWNVFKGFLRAMKMNSFDRKMYFEMRRGQRDAMAVLASLGHSQ